MQPLATCMHNLQLGKMAIGLQISEPWLREYQVLICLLVCCTIFIFIFRFNLDASYMCIMFESFGEKRKEEKSSANKKERKEERGYWYPFFYGEKLGM